MTYYIIIISLFIILLIHFIIQKLLTNEIKPKVLLKLPSEEIKEEMTDIKQDMTDMKQELLKFINNNEIYKENDEDNKKKLALSNFESEKTDLSKFFKKDDISAFDETHSNLALY